MIQLKLSQFYARDFVDEGFELYMLKDAAKHIMYVGISHGGVWSRWFGGPASHMQVDAHGALRGNSRIGTEIQRGLPQSLDWELELWTYEDCVDNLLREGITTIGGRDVRRLSLFELESYWIHSLAPRYNVMHQRDEHDGRLQTQHPLLKTAETPTSINLAIDDYIRFIELSDSANTSRTYHNALKMLSGELRRRGIDPTSEGLIGLDEAFLAGLARHLDEYAPSTRKLYSHAILQFLDFLVAEDMASLNLPRLRRALLRQRRRPCSDLQPRLEVDGVVELLEFVQGPRYTIPASNDAERLRAMRDRAFLLTLADTGLRVHEGCKLRRGDLDLNEEHAAVIGKGDKRALVRFSDRSIRAVRDYLGARAVLDGNSGKPLASLPLFARHDKGAGKKIKSITTATGRNIVHERVQQALGDNAGGHITPHSLRHYFVTAVLRASGNLKMAQELARHTSIQVTQRYAHLSNDELDRGYHEIFNKPQRDAPG